MRPFSWLRAVSGVAGLLNCWLALLCLRWLFPGNLPAQAVGFLVAAFLPPHLLLSQYVTNEPLAGLFVTLALYLCLRLLRSDGQCLGLHLGLGLALGAALLTKASVLLTVPLVVAALGLRLLACPRHSFADWCRAVGVVLVSCLAVCGWYYARVWARFGSPVVGNWDAAAGLTWWQEPGFRTSAFYLGFGRVLVSPLFSALHSFPDGLYSTLWGDGLISGIVRMTYRPPWNYDLMGVAYLLALGLSALLILGGAVALVRFIRRPSIEWFLVLGLVAVLGLGILFMSLRVPSYAQVKAFDGFRPWCLSAPWWPWAGTGCANSTAPLVPCFGLWCWCGFSRLARPSGSATATL